MTDQPALTRLVEMIFPDQANHYGTLFAGNALNILSKAAFLSASRHARQNVVMAACSEVTFIRPVRVGQALEIQAQVVRSGCSSMTVKVTGTTEILATGEQHAAMHGRFEMVAIDLNGAPVTFAPSTGDLPQSFTAHHSSAALAVELLQEPS